jgi:hypothetical protein
VLGGEDVRACLLLALQTPQSAHLITLHRMDARRATFGATNVKPAATGEFTVVGGASMAA